ncbi:NADH-quinone oxidoreductase subunit B [Halorhabdus sp. CBA1104]|uniref:NADH-quinone oxidoreductase subunit B family protein n=1 Tax=Halorhabdus sp. CBA1104 TaxID=1380432 RepID=UPI0012B23225|nr:NADH-quinone oxidoreductase subunit B family protein [Halorhabdus sp. CBA1104]QGN06320.1 NADH-quinone oxidoreductase subunit B [Halorhabdus sp. CBA1104]
MGRIIDWARNRSPWILHLNCGSCNGCDIETLDALMPRYDIERFGIRKKDTPRHADILVATGPVTKQMAPRLERVYEQMPEPKLVLAAGSCASTGGVFHDCYNCHEGVDDVIPVDMYVPGCPTSPEALIDGIVKLLDEAGQKAQAERLADAKPEIIEEGARIDQAVPPVDESTAQPSAEDSQEGQTDESEPVEA